MLKYLLLCVGVMFSSVSVFAETGYDRPVNDKIDSGKIDYFIQGKGGNSAKGNAECEDGLFYNNNFIAIFDGATDKSGKKYDGKKGGRIARDIIEGVFKNLPANSKPGEVLDKINNSYQTFYKTHSDMDFEKNPLLRPTATLIWYSFERKELVAIGDSKARIDGKKYNKKNKMVDVLNSALRVRVIKELKLSDGDVAKDDIGRFYIMPLLQQQSEFQNNPKAPKQFQYWAIDGFQIPSSEILVWSFKKTPKVIELSTDGYDDFPKKSDVKDYEILCAKLLKEDPQRIKNPSTKGLQKGNVSFDDRAVLIYKAN